MPGRHSEKALSLKEDERNMVKNLHVFILLAALAVAVYANSFQNDFVWDDEYLITNNTHVQEPSVKHALLFFKDNLGKYGQDENNFFRPLQELSYMLDYTAWKMNPVGFHLTNLLLHILAAFFLFLAAFHICQSRTIGLISALLYLVHPLHTEAVTYIAGRADSLMAVFLLISFYFYILRKKAALSYIAFIFALISKETAIMFPVILLCYEAVFNEKGIRLTWPRYAPYLTITAGYIALRATVLNFKYPVAAISAGVGFYERLLTAFRALKEYFRLIVLPFDLHMERALVFSRSFFEKNVFISFLLFAVIVIVMFALKKKHKPAFFGLGWFFITIFPLSNIPFALNATMAEHWLYVPLIGIAVTAGYGLVRFAGIIAPRNREISNFLITVISFCVIIYLSAITISQNKVWRDSETLYNHTLRYAPESPRVHYNLGNTYREGGRLLDAEREYKISIELDPNFHSSHFNLGLTYTSMGDFETAITEFQKSAELEPGSYKSYNALGLAYKDKGEPDKAVLQYKKALELAPDYADAHNNLGDAYFNNDMYEEAEDEFRKALAINPSYAQALNNLGVSLITQGRAEEAVSAWKASLKINPQQPVITEYIMRNTADR
jgi:protein O-mannosyl-transferase